jgi:hypothetical protein
MGVEPPRSNASNPLVGEADPATRRRLLADALKADSGPVMRADFKPISEPRPLEGRSGRERQINAFVENAVRGDVVGTVRTNGGPEEPLTAKPITREEFMR